MKILMQLSLLALVLASLQNALGQSYPSKPVRIIVTSQAGTGSDLVARYSAESLSRTLGQQFFVENRVGAGGNIGMAAAAKSAPDGYTLVLGGLGNSVMNQFLYSSLGFDPEKDFEPIVLVARLPFLIAVNPSFTARSIPELVAAAKAKPDSINVSVSSTTTRIVYELFRKSSGASLFPISYKGPGPAINDTIDGRVSVIIETVALLLPHVTSGKLEPIAITTLKTSLLMPAVKPVAEQGVQSFGEIVGWTGFFAPKGTPREVVNVINAEMNKILAQPQTRKRLLDLGFEAGSGTAQELATYVISERERWGPIIKSANIRAN